MPLKWSHLVPPGMVGQEWRKFLQQQCELARPKRGHPDSMESSVTLMAAETEEPSTANDVSVQTEALSTEDLRVQRKQARLRM